MAEYLSPGVYVEEISSGVKPIAGVGTSTGGFVGITEKGPINKATLITNWTQFVNNFGGFINDGLLAYGVYNFFNEGGTKCFVTRVDNTTESTKASIARKLTFPNTGGVADIQNIQVTFEAKEGGVSGNSLRVSVPDAGADPAAGQLLVGQEVGGVYTTTETHAFASKAEFLAITSELITISEAGTNSTQLYNKAPLALAGGSASVTDFIGNEANREGIHSFDTVDEVNILAIPDAKGDSKTMKAGFTYCEGRGDCFFIMDSPKETDGSATTPSEILALKNGTYGTPSSFGALYYPWISVSDPLGTTKLVPPSAAVAGVYSRTDVDRGVWKAPAGTIDGYLRSALSLQTDLTKGEQDTLNPAGVNAIRSYPGIGICVWGTRTISSDAEWKYIPLRRLFLFIEESIDEASQWVVFEPNDPKLWGNVKRNLTAFLTGLWRDGALFGATANEAFFVKIDAENNPPDVRDAGQLIIEIGVAPVKPAEFVIIRVSQKTLAA